MVVQQQIKLELQEKRSPLNISLDVWISPNRVLYLGIVGHYVPKLGKGIKIRLLGLKQIYRHSAEEQ
jgi:hypothetical protein